MKKPVPNINVEIVHDGVTYEATVIGFSPSTPPRTNCRPDDYDPGCPCEADSITLKNKETGDEAECPEELYEAVLDKAEEVAMKNEYEAIRTWEEENQ